MTRLSNNFFARNTLTIARELLGKYLVRRIPSTRSGQAAKVVRARITETEAYCGVKDKANHASKGLTERTKVMFGPPGRAYIYLIYGMYHCFNVVTREEGCPEAVLIRAAISCKLYAVGNGVLKPKAYSLKLELNGPGKLCRALKIDRRLNGVDLCHSKDIWLEDRREKPPKIKKGKRIGVDYAGKWKDKLWRFFL